jgi:tetratricopeptide (TPR) repeat protein
VRCFKSAQFRQLSIMADDPNTLNKALKQTARKLLEQTWQITKALWRQAVALYRYCFWQPLNWLNYAEKQYNTGDLDGAIASCNQAIRCDSDSYSAWYKKGHILSDLQRNQESVDCFDKAIRINPRSHEAWFEQGTILVRLQRYKQAIESYSEALRIQPNFRSAWVKKGDLLSDEKQHRSAADCYEQALKIQPRDTEVSEKLDSLLAQLQESAEILLIQANSLCEVRDFGGAIKAYDQALVLRPDFNEAWYRRGNALLELNQCEEAISSYEKALNLEPENYQALFGKGNVLLALQRYQEAIDFYNKALKLKPDDGGILSKREFAVSELQKLEERTEDVLKQGMSLHDSGKYEDAIKIYDQIIELISKNLVSKS